MFRVILLVLILLIGFGGGYTINRAGQVMPDFTAIKPFQARQKAFIDYLAPQAQWADKLVLQRRARIEQLFLFWQQHHWLSLSDAEWLQSMAEMHQLPKFTPYHQPSWQILLDRVDVVPTSLLIAQAINESAWGTSRFAREGNNLFGQHCRTKDCGIAPKDPPKGHYFEVKKFVSPELSIEAYIFNLNTNPQFKRFRQLRAKLRQEHQPLNGHLLAQGLVAYSIKGQHYVKILQSIIHDFNLERFDQS